MVDYFHTHTDSHTHTHTQRAFKGTENIFKYVMLRIIIT